MKEKDSYLEASVKKSRFLKNKNDFRIFPMSDTNGRTIWANLVRKSSLLKKDNFTNRLSMHLHVLRKFFRSYLGNSDLAEHLMGHASGMDKYYRNVKPEDLAAEYIKLMQNVTIFSNIPDLTEVNAEIIKLKLELSNRDRQINELFEHLVRLEKKR